MESLKERLWTTLLLTTIRITLLLPGVLATENGNSTEYIQTLGGKVTLNCSESYLSATFIHWEQTDTIGVKEYKSIISHDCLSNRIQTYNNTRVTTPNTTCNAPSKDFYLQIESVDVTDEGEYKCDIATRKGNFQKIFSLTVIVPPNISISCENNSNGTKTAVCTASNGKPKGNITWQPTNEENIISTVENSNSTVTVQSKYIITDTSNYKGHLTCIVTHPALKERLNYVFPLYCSPSPGSSSPNITIALCSVCLLCFALTLAKCFFHKQLRNNNSSCSCQKETKSDESVTYLENIVYDSLQLYKPNCTRREL